MSTRDTSSSEDPIIESRDQLVAPMAGGEKPKDAWRIGTEHEKLVYCRKTFKAPSYAAISVVGTLSGSVRPTIGTAVKPTITVTFQHQASSKMQNAL